MADKSFGVDQLDILGTGTPTISAPNQLNLDAHTVAISTSVTVGEGMSAVNISATGISTIAQPANSNPMANWTITNNLSSAYRFTGPGQSGSDDNPDLYLVRGHRYIFKHNATSSHPIQIRVANGGAAYTDGITYSDTSNNRTTDGNNLIINLQHDAPARLFYQCTAHGSMVGNIYTVGGPQVISGVVTATTFVGNLTGNVTGTASANAVLTGSTNNTLVTVTGANAITGESTLTYNGTDTFELQPASATPAIFIGDSNRTGAGQGLAQFRGNWNGTTVARITFDTGDDTSNKDDGIIRFDTAPSGGSLTERLRITQDGNIGFYVTSPQLTKGIQISKGGQNSVLTSYSVANEYLHLGAGEYNGTGGGSGLFAIGFGYIHTAGNTSTYAPAYIGFKETSTSSRTRGDLVFATRSSTTDSEPTVRLSIKSTGAIDIPSTSYISGSIGINVNSPQLTNGLQVSKGGGSGGTPTTGQAANEYLHLGHADYATNGLYLMGFGYINNCTYSPAYIGLKTQSTSSCTRGDLIFATRTSTVGTDQAAERLRIRYNGLIGINETSPQRHLHITGDDGTTGATSGNSDTQLIIENAGSNGAIMEFLSDTNGAGRIFFTDSGTSNQGGIEYLHNGDYFQVSSATSTQGVMALHLRKNNAANNVQSDMIAFDVGASGRGKIVSAPNGSSSPQFSSYSDRRLKTNFRDYTGGYDRIKSIPVKLYDEVLNDQTKSVFGDNVKTDVIGWIADEVQSVFPDAVMGTKDEVDSDGKPVYQSLTEGTFLPDAIQAIQKLIQKVETLEAKVAALEGS